MGATAPRWARALPAAGLAAVLVLVSRGATDTVDARLAALLARRRRPGLTRLMRGLSAVGRPPAVAATAALAGALLVHGGRHRQALGLAAVLGGEAVLRLALKFGVQRGRPATPRIGAKGYSFPSGHAMGAATFLGALLAAGWHDLPPALRPPALVGAVALATGIGGSRVYLGAHHPSDVAGGWLGALAWLLVALPLVARRRPSVTSGSGGIGDAGVGVQREPAARLGAAEGSLPAAARR